MLTGVFTPAPPAVPAKKNRRPDPATLAGPALVKETNRRLRAAVKLWDAHRNAACRAERAKALALYERLSPKQREQVPQHLRTWLRFRSEKYFGATRGGGNGAHEKVRKRAQRPGGAASGDSTDGDSTDGDSTDGDDAAGDDEWAGVGL